MYICIFIYICICIYIYIYIYIYICTYVYINVHTYLYTLRVDICIYLYIYMYTPIYTCTCIYIYTYIHTVSLSLTGTCNGIRWANCQPLAYDWNCRWKSGMLVTFEKKLHTCFTYETRHIWNKKNSYFHVKSDVFECKNTFLCIPVCAYVSSRLNINSIYSACFEHINWKQALKACMDSTQLCMRIVIMYTC